MFDTESLLSGSEVEAGVWRASAQLARALRVKDAQLQPTLAAVVSTAVEAVGPADYAGLILMEKGRLQLQVTTGAPAETLDRWQRDHGFGPCIAAAEGQWVVHVDNTAEEDRWDDFGRYAAELGVGSMLCVPLWVDQRRLGTLSLYAAQPQVFTDAHVPLVNLFATHAALALGSAQHADNMQAALDNRDLIGQAKGILMERNHITAGAAFTLLSEMSQTTNRKLVVVAQHLVDTGELLTAELRPR